MNITEFLEARIAEDESRAWSELGAEYFSDGAWPEECANRLLAECAAKRAIAAEHVRVDYTGLGMESPNACSTCGAELNMHDWDWVEDSFPCQTLRALAAVYKDHPDYQQEWAD